MKLLLDTHIAIWLLTDRARIPRAILETINNSGSDVFVSVIAVWEIAIKHRLARPDSPPFSGQAAIGHFETAGFASLPVNSIHAAFVERLPPIHADPFDRLMLAQSIVEGMQFVTYDKHLARYDVALLTW
ncbi:type II toxin-antitoxin system VapC family toxin [Mesorhizobium sp. CAU 1732]|uniref:type II toxin-antitoxin system VapC family toxin n=1 Tax=Mesorhizobium sp. CAU 1732 TaxID=3140358 RepID=UPI0032601BFF